MNDLKFAVRQLLKSPGFAAVAVLTLAVGIGANTAIFSVLNAVWMRSLPVKDPHRLRVVHWSGHNVQLSNWTGGGQSQSRSGAQVYGAFPHPVYEDFKRQVKGCSAVFSFYGLQGLTVGGPDGATTADALMVSGNFFEGYGAGVFLGRTILPGDDASESGPIAVVTHRFWEKVFGLDPAVLGKTITLNQHPFRIVGVLPRTFCGPEIGDAATVYVPMSAQPLLSTGHPLEARDHWWAKIMARLEPGANETQIVAAMKGIFLQTLSAQEQQTRMEQPGILLQDGSRGLLGIRRMMAAGIALVLGAVGLVLVIACANLAGLLLARGSARQHEFGVRAALGAGRARLLRQLLVECFVLSLAGAALGCVLATWAQSVLLRFLPDTLQGFRFQVTMDFRVLLFALAAAVLTTLLSALLPALRVTQVDLGSTLKSRAGGGSPNPRLGRVLVVAQVAISVLLVVGSGLLFRTLVNLHRVELGFIPTQLLVFRVNPGQAGLDEARRRQFYDQLHESLQALPGVQSVGMSSVTLLGGRRVASAFSVPGQEKAAEHGPMADHLDVNEDFFRTTGIPILRGRAFERADAASESRVAVVNRTFAATFFGSADPLGQVVRKSGSTDCRIVGICGDARYDSPQRQIEPTVFLLHRQGDPGAMTFEVRTALDPLGLGANVRAAVARLNRDIPVEDLSTQSQLLSASLMPGRILSALGGTLALLGIGLSGMGLHALLSFMITRRTSDIGVRLALGARPGDIARPVVGLALRLAGIGLLIGIPAAVGLGQVLQGVLFGVRPHDPVTLIVTAALILALAAFAAWTPARRAARVDPIVALRTE